MILIGGDYTGKRITIEDEQRIVQSYLEFPKTIWSTAREFDLSAPTIIKILDKYEVKRYTKAQLYNPGYNEDYFENIDTQAKAYFLGLIISDGNVFTDGGGGRQASISITLDSGDEYLLTAFKNEIGVNTSVCKDGRGCSQIAVRSDKMAKDLNRLGVFPRKSFQTQLPCVPKHLYPHLIRGILDGDGSIQSKQTNIRGRHKHSIGFCGTEQLMKQVSGLLIEELGLSCVSVYTYKNRSLSMVTWSAIDDLQKLIAYLYQDAEIYMLRKRAKAENFLNHYNLQYGNTEITIFGNTKMAS